MAGQYRVDLDELDIALRQLYDFARRLDAALATARYETGLARESLGTAFDEAHELYAEHASIKVQIEDAADHLNASTAEVIKKLTKMRGTYEDAEYQE